MIPALQLGKIQVIAAGLTATPQRARNVLFTNPYLEGDPLIIISRNTFPIETVGDLNGKEVIVNEGYTADLYMSQISGPILKRLKTVAEAFLALTSGRAIAFVTAKNAAQPFFDKQGAEGYHIAVIPGTDENSSLAVSQKYPELLAEIQSVLDHMKKDGFISNLRTKWGL